MYNVLSLIFNSGLRSRILFFYFYNLVSINHFSMCG